MNSENRRSASLRAWLNTLPEMENASMAPASNDASFRRYFRLTLADGTTRIVMDAPPEHENCEPFIRIAGILTEAGLNAPRCAEFNEPEGFLLLSDLGSETFLQRLNQVPEQAQQLYPQALSALVDMQFSTQSQVSSLPAYNQSLLQQEMALFKDWLLAEHLGVHLDKQASSRLQQQFDFLATSAISQPSVFVHRDYHSRNLMISADGRPGILDFQDAVQGPITYDAVSLLRDCYVSWPDRQIYDWLRKYFEELRAKGLVKTDFEKFARWFDLMGVQRHLKAAGIFCRLLHRDGKDGYIGDIPRTLNYVLRVSDRYRELRPLHEMVVEHCSKPFGLAHD